jgi:predicted ArsR family transcriptional regulator
VPGVKVKPTRRATDGQRDDNQDGRLMAIVNRNRGISLSAIAAALGSNVDPTSIRRPLMKLVAEGRITNYGRARAAKYWPAGTTAKEAL